MTTDVTELLDQELLRFRINEAKSDALRNNPKRLYLRPLVKQLFKRRGGDWSALNYPKQETLLEYVSSLLKSERFCSTRGSVWEYEVSTAYTTPPPLQ